MCQLVINNVRADMHNHTRASDGLQSPFRTILRAYNNGINVIAFSDHNSVESFKKLEEQIYAIIEIIKKDSPLEIKFILDILENVKVLKGTELITSYNGVIVEVLGYNYDLNKMSNEIEKLKGTIKEKTYETLYNFFNIIIDKNGLVLDKSVLDQAYNNIRVGRGGLTVPFFNELISHKENIRYLTYIDDFGEEKVADTLKLFINKHLYNTDSMFFVDMSKTRPSFQDTIDAIHRAGGIAFLAHPGRYKDKINIEYYLDDMIFCGLDGLEVFYPDHSFEFRKLLLDKVKEHKLMASGGSDDHNTVKEGIHYQTGSVTVPNILETKWISDTINKKKDFFNESEVIQSLISELKKNKESNQKKIKKKKNE